LPLHAKGPLPGSSYIYGIDIIRFVSALSVAVFHLTWGSPNQVSGGLPFGWVGVQVFFVISGLVIANSAYGSTPRQFCVGRFLRLYPAAWCALLLNIAFIASAPRDAYVTQGLLVSLAPRHVFGSIVLMGQWRVASAYWTLPIEFAFYALVALLLAKRRFKDVQFWAILLILWSIPLLAVLQFTSLGWPRHSLFLTFGYGVRNISLLRHGCYFGLGMLIWAFKEKRITAPGFAACGLALALAWTEIFDRARGIQQVLLHPVFFDKQLTPLSLAAFAYIAFLVAVLGIVLSVKLNAWFPQQTGIRSVVRLLGLATYPFYLLHEAVGGLVADRMYRLGFGPAISLISALFVIGALSVLIAAYMEPLLRSALKRAGTRIAHTRLIWAPAVAPETSGGSDLSAK
jgi:exopolysaccharide production protein ExoZ